MGEHIGYGVVATKLIPRGTITWVRDPLDREIPAAQIQALGPLYVQAIEKYSWVDLAGNYVLCWDTARYVNHSCEPTCLSAGPFDFTIAVRDIRPGEEITDDYGTLNLLESFRCACGSPRCRRDVAPEDPSFMTESWDGLVVGAFPSIGAVAQPLWPLLSPQVKEAVELQLRDPSKLGSIGEQLVSTTTLSTHRRAG